MHHAVDPQRMRTFLWGAAESEIPEHLTVWLHLGHGVKGGLYGSAGSISLAHEWLNSFCGKIRSVALVFFSSCYSVEAAKLFAEEGAGVAVGFGKAVDAETCRILSAPMVRAALRFNGAPYQILAAFRTAIGDPSLKADAKAFCYLPGV